MRIDEITGASLADYIEKCPSPFKDSRANQQIVRNLRDAYFQELGLDPPIAAEKKWTYDNVLFNLSDPAIQAQARFVQAWFNKWVKGKIRLYRAECDESRHPEQVSFSWDEISAREYMEYAQEADKIEGIDADYKIVSREFPVSSIINCSPFVGFTDSRDIEREVIVSLGI